MKLISDLDANSFQDDVSVENSLRTLRVVAAALATAVEAMEEARHPDMESGVDFYEEVRRFEVALIRRALRHTGGNQSQAARLLGLKQTTLHGKIKQYHIYPSALVFGGEPPPRAPAEEQLKEQHRRAQHRLHSDQLKDRPGQQSAALPAPTRGAQARGRWALRLPAKDGGCQE